MKVGSRVFFFLNRQVIISIKTLQGNMLTKTKQLHEMQLLALFLLTFFFKLNIEEHNYCRVHQHGGYYVAKIFITHTKFFSSRAHRILAKCS